MNQPKHIKWNILRDIPIHMIWRSDQNHKFHMIHFLPLVQQWQESNRTHAGLILSKELPVPELLRRFRRFLHQHQTDDLTNLILWLYP